MNDHVGKRKVVEFELEGIKIQKIPKEFFDAEEETLRVEMRRETINTFHSLRAPLRINLIRHRTGTLSYFITAPDQVRQVIPSIIAHFHRWDIGCEKIPFNLDNLFPSESTVGAAITFTPDQHFWDRLRYSQVQHANFFKVLQDVKTPLWIQITLTPTQPAKILKPLAKQYKGEFRKYARKEKRGKLNGALRNEYLVLSARHQNSMNLAYEESLFAVTYRVVAPSPFDGRYGDNRTTRLLNKPFKKGHHSLAMREGGMDVVTFRQNVRGLAAALFVGIPGRIQVKYYQAKDIWMQFNSSKRPRQSPTHVMLGRAEVEWIFPWPTYNLFGWEFLPEKGKNIEQQGGYVPLDKNTEGGEIFPGYQDTKVSEIAVSNFPLVHKHTAQEVNLRPPRFQDSSSEVVPKGSTEVSENTRNVTMERCSNKSTTSPGFLRERRTEGTKVQNNEPLQSTRDIPRPQNNPQSLVLDGLNNIRKVKCEGRVKVIPPVLDGVHIPQVNDKNKELPLIIKAETPDQKCKEFLNRVFEFLADNCPTKGISLEKIEDACNIKRTELLQVLRILQDEGSIHETRAGKFAVA
ncbi:MAG: hypothetical protein RBG13Loki_2417 [Promethearchaeota archaeon CR_4]|nr:MAG: hypothetical protein RBG13Loki_2417 [Candidatus Lokiarchaeota archaeon CR_4]